VATVGVAKKTRNRDAADCFQFFVAGKNSTQLVS